MKQEVRVTNQFAWADALRVYAAMCVIFLHVAATGVLAYPGISLTNWWVCNLYDSAVRYCVPLFIMLSGALLLPTERPLSVYLKKRVTRIVIPWLFWSIIYLVYHYLKKDAGDPQGIGHLVKWVYAKMQTGAEFHFWYIYMVLGILLFVPVIGRFARAAPAQELLFFLGIWVLTLFSNYPIFSKYWIRVDLTYFSGYLGYLILGYYLSVKSDDTKGLRWLAIGAIGVGYLITLLGTYWRSRHDGQFSEQFYNPLTPNVALMAAGIFYLFRHAKLPAITGMLAIIKENSYTIYLSHILVLHLLLSICINEFVIMPLFGIPLLSILVLVGCVIIAWIINKTFLAKYIGG